MMPTAHLPLAAVAVLIALGVFATGGELLAPAEDGYRLVWSDEFDRAGQPDPAIWVPEVGFVRNRELQWYQRANATCADGLLTIEARRESVLNPQFKAGSGDWKQQRPQSIFTSACLTTQGTREWKYGRFELRARIPVAQGTWPAFWTLGKAREWPANGEIDVLEAYQGKLLANLVWGSGKPWVGTWDTTQTPFSELGDPLWATQFHVWRMDWDATAI